MPVPKRSSVIYLAAAVVAYFALWALTPRAVFLPLAVNAIDQALPWIHPRVANVLSLLAIAITAAPTIVFMAVQIAIVYYFALLKLNVWKSLLWLIGGLAAAAGLLGLIVWRSGFVANAHRLPNWQELAYIAARYPHPLKMPLSVCLMLVPASVGHMVSLRIKDRNLILPVVMFAAWIDLWTVTQGPVSVVMKKAPAVVEAVSAPIPQAGAGAFVPVTLVGPGDFLFMGLVFAAVHRLGMDSVRNFWFIYAAMTLGMLAVMFGLVSFLPALILLAAAVVAANWRSFHLSRQEIISVAVVAAVLLAALPLVSAVLRPADEKPAPASPRPAASPSGARR